MSLTAFNCTYVGRASARLTKDGKYGLISAFDNTLTLWDIWESNLIKSYPDHTNSSYINEPVLRTSPRGDTVHLFAGGEDGNLRAWNFTGGECVGQKKLGGSNVQSLDIDESDDFETFKLVASLRNGKKVFLCQMGDQAKPSTSMQQEGL